MRSTAVAALVASLGATLAAEAADFREISLTIVGGWGSAGSIAVAADGTLLVPGGRSDDGEAAPCATPATQEEIDALSEQVRQIPEAIPRSGYLIVGETLCRDDLTASLAVRTMAGELQVRYSLDPNCQSTEVPVWLTRLVETMSALRERYAACPTEDDTGT